MFKLAVVGTLAAYLNAKQHPINEDIVKEIKAKATTWIPHEVAENPLRHHSAETLQGLLGDSGSSASNENVQYAEQEILAALPDNFDARVTFADCVHPIRDQQRCGSCWAFGSSEALSDRFCVASKGKVDKVLSVEELVSCDYANSGCNGGWIGDAFNYFQSKGIVEDSCFPYTAGNGVEAKC
jgi:cathepsin B